MHSKYYVLAFLYLLNANGANLYRRSFMNEYSAPYLKWIEQIRHMPEMKWLYSNPYAKNNLLNQLYLPHNYNNIQTVSPYAENYCNQRPNFFTYPRYYSQQSPIQLNFLRPHCLRKIVTSNNTELMPQQMMLSAQPKQMNSFFRPTRQIARKQMIYQYPLNNNPKLQPMMCVPIHSQQELDIIESKGAQKEIDKNLDDDLIPEDDYEKNCYDENSWSDNNDSEKLNQSENAIPEVLNSRQVKNTSPQISAINQSKFETTRLKPNIENNDVENKKGSHKKKKRRKRRRGPRINKKIGRTLLKGLHIAEDFAASGALGPQMKAAAIAAEAAETAINGAIKGESAAEIMKKTAMTAASAAVGGSMKAQIIGGLATQSGLPVPPVATNGGTSSESPLGMAGGGNLKNQMINQAKQQAITFAAKEAAKNAAGNQIGQVVNVS